MEPLKTKGVCWTPQSFVIEKSVNKSFYLHFHHDFHTNNPQTFLWSWAVALCFLWNDMLRDGLMKLPPDCQGRAPGFPPENLINPFFFEGFPPHISVLVSSINFPTVDWFFMCLPWLYRELYCQIKLFVNGVICSGVSSSSTFTPGYYHNLSCSANNVINFRISFTNYCD